MGYGFSFNGHHCSEFGLAVKNRNRQLLPAVNDRYLEIPGRHGSYHFPGELQDRVIELECAFMGASRENLREKAREIAAWFYTKEKAVLSFDDEPGKYYYAKLDGAIDTEQLSVLATFSLVFRCEPLAYGEDEEVFFEGNTALVNNQGTFEALPVFSATFTSTASEWKVSLGTKYIRVVHSFQVGDTLEVNCATGAVLINGGRALDKLDWQNSEFFALPPGENTLAITPTGICTAMVTFKPRWL